MAFPVIQVSDSKSGSFVAAGSRVCTIPDNVVAGDRLIAAVSVNTITTVSWDSGFNEIGADTGVSHTLSVAEKIAVGGDSSPTATFGASNDHSFFHLRITGAHASTATAVSTAFNGSTTNPDPPSLNPSGWDVEDTLWIAVVSQDNNVTSTPTYSSGYSGGTEVVNPGRILMYCWKNNAAASEDPGAFTVATADASAAYTLGVRPGDAVAAGTPFRPRRMPLGV